MKHVLIVLALFATVYSTQSQDTFSICAFDPETGEVGSAGATCIESSNISAVIISDVHPGHGVIHTQAYWLSANQQYATQLMMQGFAAQDIIDSLVANDVQQNSSIRQYGVVRLDQGGQSAAYTGNACDDYKNHILGPNYAIQGNILLGQQILDSMESRFNSTEGNLACKLMAALQGAKVIGADTRCEDNGTSSFSAFIRVAQVDEDYGNISLDISVNTYSTGTEPIDSLQVLFEAEGGCSLARVESPVDLGFQLIESGGEIHISLSEPLDRVMIYDVQGKLVFDRSNIHSRSLSIPVQSLSAGVFLIQVKAGDHSITRSWAMD